jgi:transcriptional regulator with XRE-family HTH domain
LTPGGFLCRIVLVTERTTVYDIERMQLDMTLLGWSMLELARQAKLAPSTVTFFLSGRRQTAKTAKKLADVLGYNVRRYVVIPRRLRGVA